MDMLGTNILSVVQRLSLLQKRKCMKVGGKQFVHCMEVVHSSECPLSEVPLYRFALRMHFARIFYCRGSSVSRVLCPYFRVS